MHIFKENKNLEVGLYAATAVDCYINEKTSVLDVYFQLTDIPEIVIKKTFLMEFYKGSYFYELVSNFEWIITDEYDNEIFDADLIIGTDVMMQMQNFYHDKMVVDRIISMTEYIEDKVFYDVEEDEANEI